MLYVICRLLSPSWRTCWPGRRPRCLSSLLISCIGLTVFCCRFADDQSLAALSLEFIFYLLSGYPCWVALKTTVIQLWPGWATPRVVANSLLKEQLSVRGMDWFEILSLRLPWPPTFAVTFISCFVSWIHVDPYVIRMADGLLSFALGCPGASFFSGFLCSLFYTLVFRGTSVSSLCIFSTGVFSIVEVAFGASSSDSVWSELSCFAFIIFLGGISIARLLMVAINSELTFFTLAISIVNPDIRGFLDTKCTFFLFSS